MLDPICDMTVEPTSPAGKFGFDGETYYFCSVHCLTAAKARQTSQPPTAYQHPPHHVESTPAVPGAIYICSMDPEVRQRGAGACPKCGMALEASRRTLAAGILYPFFGILLSPMIASAGMTFSSVSVISNALRLNRLKL